MKVHNITYYCPVTHYLFKCSTTFLPNMWMDETYLRVVRVDPEEAGGYSLMIVSKFDDESSMPKGMKEVRSSWRDVIDHMSRNEICVEESVLDMDILSKK